MLTYVGKGYSKTFVQNMNAISERLNRGETIAVTNGPDDICSALIAEDPAAHCAGPSPSLRDAAALRDLEHTLKRSLKLAGSFSLESKDRHTLRAAFASGSIRRACAGCEWSTLCTDISKDGYQAARLNTDLSNVVRNA
jgi:uncharacterized protein